MNTMDNTFSLSANLETGLTGSNSYIVTPNAEKVLQEILTAYRTGIHSFTIIGSYGTGKSSFLLNFENDLRSLPGKRKLFLHPEMLFKGKFEFLNIIGDVKPLSELLLQALHEKSPAETDGLSALKSYSRQLKNQGRFLIIAIDEFGKILEYAAKHHPEEELYSFQKLTEFVNAPSRDILLLTTLHQNFSAYASKLTETQRHEWTKVKGRFHEVVFAEPVEQLIFLAAEQISSDRGRCLTDGVAGKIHRLAVNCKFISDSLSRETVEKLYPLDVFAAYTLTRAIQRYGQNERSLFSFLNYAGEHAVRTFKAGKNSLYNLAEAYDYLTEAFHSVLLEAHSDMAGWNAIQIAIERVEGSPWKDKTSVVDAIRIVKAIGMLNMFGNGAFSMTARDMDEYASMAMDVRFAGTVLSELQRLKIIRYAEYRHRLILFEGTDINLEEEMAHASLAVPRPESIVDDLRRHFDNRVSAAKACFYHRGTPRYFEYQLLSEVADVEPSGDVDGFVQMIFPLSEGYLQQLKSISRKCTHAIVYACFTRTDVIVERIHKIQQYQYILDKVLIDKSDRVAVREITQSIDHERTLLNKLLNEKLFDYDGDIVWLFRGETVKVNSQRDFNRLLSRVCDEVYPSTPVIHNELMNRHRLSSNISAARVKYLQAMLECSDQEDFGFETDKFPPEKTIYCSLLKSTGLHVDGSFQDVPANPDVMAFWNACEEFMRSTAEKPKKVSELIKLLSAGPYKMKDGFLDFWIPTYLFMKRQDYSLYGDRGQFIPNVNGEFFDLLKKHPADFKVKAYVLDGVKLQFFNQYRKLVGQGEMNVLQKSSFMETIKPFFFFYSKQLNEYAKQTRRLDHIETLRFREALAKAKDPEKTFFEDLPEALGYDKSGGEDFLQSYCRLIQQSIKELKGCYGQLIDRIEAHLTDTLGVKSADYPLYVEELQHRLSKVKQHLLTPRQLSFYQHFMAQFDNRTEWFQSVCYAVLGSPLDRLRDEQEAKLLDDLVFLYKECERQAVLSESLNYKMDDKEKQRSARLESKIDAILSGDDNLDIATLLRVLQKKMDANG